MPSGSTTSSGDSPSAVEPSTLLLEHSVLGIVLLVILLLLVYTLRTGISPVPTTPRVARVMLAMLPALPPGRVYELGSGWGGLAIALARRLPERAVVAVELSPLPWLLTRVRLALAPCPNLILLRGDFHALSLADAALVACYLYPGAMARLRPKLEAELPPGALVVSNSFAVPGWTATDKRIADDQYASPVYLYTMPASATAE
jgi:predicted O-methyltransferase YrrM